jgi:hypothetical protein
MGEHDCQIAVRRAISEEDKDDPTLLVILALAKALDMRLNRIEVQISNAPSPKVYMRRPR